MAKKKHQTYDDAPEAASTEAAPRAVLVGNHVSGFTIYPLPSVSDEDAARLVAHVPEARLVDVHAFDELIDKHGALPEPANTEPKTKPVEAVNDDDAGTADNGAEGSADGDVAGSEDREPK